MSSTRNHSVDTINNRTSDGEIRCSCCKIHSRIVNGEHSSVIGPIPFIGGHWFKSKVVSTICILILMLLHNVDSRSVPGPTVSRYRHISPKQKTLNYLQKFGYLSGPNRETASLLHMTNNDFKNALKRLQRMGGLPQTGQLDRRTMELMETPRCGVSDDEYNNYRRRRKRYKLGPSKWPRTNITFKIENYTPDMTMVQTRQTVFEAFKMWSDYSTLSFAEVMHDDADMRIRFATRYHEDSYPFDGKGLVLAHAFFPGDDRGGDVHFDDDEDWRFKDEEDGVNLFMAAAHEMGHALGLSHSPDASALMYAWYQGYQENYQLPRDDRAAIQRLYGFPTNKKLPDIDISNVPDHGKVTTPGPTPESKGGEGSVTTPKSQTPWDPDRVPDPCTDPFDAINILRQELILFIGNWMWRMELDKTFSSAPTTIHQFWHQLPRHIDHIDAFYERNDHKFVFFSGDKYWVLEANQMDSKFPERGRRITELGIPDDISKVDAVFIWGYNQRTYIISGDMYWKMNENDTHIEFDYPRDVTSIWSGVKVPVDTAFQDADGKTYFFRGKYYSQFYDMKMRVRKGWPKLISEHFLKSCNQDIVKYSNASGETQETHVGDTVFDCASVPKESRKRMESEGLCRDNASARILLNSSLLILSVIVLMLS